MRYADLFVGCALLPESGGWAVKVGDLPLTPTEARDLSQRLYALALEVSERDAPRGPDAMEQLRKENEELRERLTKERQKRDELARSKATQARSAPARKLEAAKHAVLYVLNAGTEPPIFTSEMMQDFRDALAWLEEFKA